MKKETQTDKVKRHMADFGSITSLEAFKEYGITRLSSAIHLLRKDGHFITSETVGVRNRYGELTHFSKYAIVK